MAYRVLGLFGHVCFATLKSKRRITSARAAAGMDGTKATVLMSRIYCASAKRVENHLSPVSPSRFTARSNASRKPYIIQCRHHLLRQPDIFILIAHLEADVALAGGGDEGQIFRGRAVQGKLLFLLRRHITAPSLRSRASRSRKSGQSWWPCCRPPWRRRGRRRSRAAFSQSP